MTVGTLSKFRGPERTVTTKTVTNIYLQTLKTVKRHSSGAKSYSNKIKYIFHSGLYSIVIDDILMNFLKFILKIMKMFLLINRLNSENSTIFSSCAVGFDNTNQFVALFSGRTFKFG